MQDMTRNEATRSTLKAEFFRLVEALGPQQALFPSKEGAIDEIVQQMEAINPILYPLKPNYLSSLLGVWRLIYASQGTIVTRQFSSVQNFWQVIKIKHVWQTLTVGIGKEITVENGAVFDFSLLGEWQLSADGVWTWGANEQVAKVTFDAFSFQFIRPFGQGSWSLPKLEIPVLEFLRKEALWTTSYLDREIRIGRGATGNLFVFCRT